MTTSTVTLYSSSPGRDLADLSMKETVTLHVTDSYEKDRVPITIALKECFFSAVVNATKNVSPFLVQVRMLK